MSDKIVFRKGLLENLEDLPIAAPGFITNPGEERLVIGGANGNVFLPNAKDINEINSSLNALMQYKFRNDITDLDLEIETDRFSFNNNPINAPDNHASYCEVNTWEYNGNKFVEQIIRNIAYKHIYRRVKNANGWTNWCEIVTDEGDSWTDFSATLNSSITGTLFARKIGNEIHVHLSMKGVLQENSIIGTLSEDFKPKHVFYQFGRFAGGIATISFYSDGKIILDKINTSALSSTSWLTVYAVYTNK